MKRVDRSSAPWLLSALPLAWATGAVLVLAPEGILLAAIALAWLGVASRYFAGRRTIVARRALALLIAIALPAQGLAAVAVGVSGPAHFHAAAKSGAPHWHAGVMHHHHAEGDAIVVDDGKRQAPASSEGKRFSFGAVDALTAAGQTFASSLPASEPAYPQVAESAPHAAHPPERPPRLLRISLPV